MSIGESLDGVASGAQAAEAAINAFNQSVLESENTLGGMIGLSKGLVTSMNQIVDSVGRFVPFAKDLGIISDTFSAMGQAITAPLEALNASVEVFQSIISVGDAMTKIIRENDAAIYGLAASFGTTFKEAQLFRNEYVRMADAVATPEFGVISPKELRATMQEMSSAGITIDRFSDSIASSAGSTDLLTTSFLHAESLGISIQSYMASLSSGMMKQGLSSQEAAQQMAIFGDISDDTGIKTDRIADSLGQLASGFTKIGLSANFGEPLLRGFVGTLEDMGLGIENALELSQSLGSAIANLSTNYASAFVTMNGGGGGGSGMGALGAGINLQARLLKAQDSGDSEAESKIAQEMAEGMRDTIASFTGGSIITVEQADQSPQLQATFYAQTQLLQSLYGLDEMTSIRTLDLLTRLDQATTTGNKEQADLLGKDLQDAVGMRNETIDATQQMSNTLSAAITVAGDKNYGELKVIREASVLTGLAFASMAGDGFIDIAKGVVDNGLGDVLDKAAKIVATPGLTVTEMAKNLKPAKDAVGDAGDALGRGNIPGAISELIGSIKGYMTAADSRQKALIDLLNSKLGS